ncbi:hypothetical protein HDU96_008816 [Phlyctochytrium bullatum]|nr:hypothetical protein HDU96_008816 [Phlyctochytrium bullatum]
MDPAPTSFAHASELRGAPLAAAEPADSPASLNIVTTRQEYLRYDAHAEPRGPRERKLGSSEVSNWMQPTTQWTMPWNNNGEVAGGVTYAEVLQSLSAFSMPEPDMLHQNQFKALATDAYRGPNSLHAPGPNPNLPYFSSSLNTSSSASPRSATPATTSPPTPSLNISSLPTSIRSTPPVDGHQPTPVHAQQRLGSAASSGKSSPSSAMNNLHLSEVVPPPPTTFSGGAGNHPQLQPMVAAAAAPAPPQGITAIPQAIAPSIIPQLSPSDSIVILPAGVSPLDAARWIGYALGGVSQQQQSPVFPAANRLPPQPTHARTLSGPATVGAFPAPSAPEATHVFPQLQIAGFSAAPGWDPRRGIPNAGLLHPGHAAMPSTTQVPPAERPNLGIQPAYHNQESQPLHRDFFAESQRPLARCPSDPGPSSRQERSPPTPEDIPRPPTAPGTHSAESAAAVARTVFSMVPPYVHTGTGALEMAQALRPSGGPEGWGSPLVWSGTASSASTEGESSASDTGSSDEGSDSVAGMGGVAIKRKEAEPARPTAAQESPLHPPPASKKRRSANPSPLAPSSHPDKILKPSGVLVSVRYRCPTCAKPFTRRSHLLSHQITHSDRRDHVCPEPNCGVRFARAHDLVRHRRTAHSEERLFRCERCGIACKRKDSLAKHVSVNCRGPVKEEGEGGAGAGAGSGAE